MPQKSVLQNTCINKSTMRRVKVVDYDLFARITANYLCKLPLLKITTDDKIRHII